MSKPATMRLDRFLGNLGYGSRKEMRGLVDAGGVVLDRVRLEVRGAGLKAAVLPSR